MRRNHEIHLVNISFIDMLAGALGAVILLYVMVPKVSYSQLEKIKTLDSLSMQAANMDSLLASLQSVVPQAAYNDLMNSSASLQATLTSLTNDVAAVQGALQKRTDQYNNLATKYETLKTQNASLQSQVKNAPSASEYQKMAAQVKTLQSQLNQVEKSKPATSKPAMPTLPSTSKPEPTQAVKDDTPGKGDAVFGINPPLTVMINWEDKADKVHLYMRQSGTNNWVFYQTKRRMAAFGTWDNSMKKLTNKPFEAIVQKEALVPGEYEIYAQPQKTTNGSVEVTGFIAMALPEKPVKRYNITPKKISDAKPPYTSGSSETLIGRLTVTTDNISWNPI